METRQDARHHAVAGWGGGVLAFAESGNEEFCGVRGVVEAAARVTEMAEAIVRPCCRMAKKVAVGRHLKQSECRVSHIGVVIENAGAAGLVPVPGMMQECGIISVSR